jgi:hypothetical protein
VGAELRRRQVRASIVITQRRDAGIVLRPVRRSIRLHTRH